MEYGFLLLHLFLGKLQANWLTSSNSPAIIILHEVIFGLYFSLKSCDWCNSMLPYCKNVNELFEPFNDDYFVVLFFTFIANFTHTRTPWINGKVKSHLTFNTWTFFLKKWMSKKPFRSKTLFENIQNRIRQVLEHNE